MQSLEVTSMGIFLAFYRKVFCYDWKKGLEKTQEKLSMIPKFRWPMENCDNSFLEFRATETEKLDDTESKRNEEEKNRRNKNHVKCNKRKYTKPNNGNIHVHDPAMATGTNLSCFKMVTHGQGNLLIGLPKINHALPKWRAQRVQPLY